MRDPDEQIADDSALQEREPSLGELLKAARTGSAIPIGDVAAELRIEARVLEALEADELGDLGPPVFVKGYIKQYGRQLGLDYDDLLAAYYRQTDAEDVAIIPNRAIQVRDERQIMIWIVTGLALLLLAVALFVWWVGGNEAPVADAGPAQVPPPSPAAALPDEAGAEPAAARPPIGADPNRDESAIAAEAAVDPDPIAEPASVADAEAAQTPGAPPGAAAEPQNDGAAAVQDQAALAPATPDGDLIPIEISFVSDSWAELSDARGVRIYYGLGRAGTRTTIYGQLPVNFFFGNADGVALTVDGAPFAIPVQSRRGNLANFVVYPTAD